MSGSALPSIQPNIPAPNFAQFQQQPLSPANVLNMLNAMQQLQKGQIEIGQAQQDAVLQAFGTLPKDAGTDEINSAALIAHARGAPMSVADQMARQLIGMNPAQRARQIGVLSGHMLSGGQFMSPIPGPVDPVTHQPTNIPAGTFRSVGTGAPGSGVLSGAPGPAAPPALPAPAPRVSEGFPTQVAPGEEPVLTGAGQRANELQATASTNPLMQQQLQILANLSGKIDTSGPTSELETNVRGVLQRLGWTGPVSTEQLANAEEFNKIANLLSAQQMRFGSNMALQHAVHSNPNLSMSQYGREGVIRMLQGQADYVDALRGAWMQARQGGMPANSYDQWLNQANRTIDPSAFIFNRLDQAGQQRFLDGMSYDQQQAFMNNYQTLMGADLVRHPKGAASAPVTPPAKPAPSPARATPAPVPPPPWPARAPTPGAGVLGAPPASFNDRFNAAYPTSYPPSAPIGGP